MKRRAKGPLAIVAYRTYGTSSALSVCGRVLRERRMPSPHAKTRRWRNLLAFYRYLHSREASGVRIVARLGRLAVDGLTDAEGYFRLSIDTGNDRRPKAWEKVQLVLADDPSVTATAEVLVPSPRARFGVISDIDDTVIQTNVLSKARMLLTVALSNAHTRKPFKGAAAFYRALHAGVNPFFYVSKSPWNLYPVLLEFFHLQRLPHGPLLLRDYGLHLLGKGRDRDHKKRTIEDILATYPRLGFVLIGDSGEKDPEIYAEVLRRHPKRVRAIYIRSVDPAPGRIRAIEALAEQVAKTGCQLVLAPDSELAAAHAAAEGLIQPSELRSVRADRRSDESIASKAAASTGALK